MEAMRTGGGVPWSAYGADAREGQADLNRVQFLNFLGTEWLPSLPDVHARLRAPGARVADWPAAPAGRASPSPGPTPRRTSTASTSTRPRSTSRAPTPRPRGSSDRVRFHVRDVAGNLEPAGGYDLVTVLEALHDMAHPVAALAAVRALAATDGAVLIMDERTNDRLTVGDPVEQFL